MLIVVGVAGVMGVGIKKCLPVCVVGLMEVIENEDGE